MASTNYSVKNYDVGDAVRCVAVFRNAAGVAADPTGVRFSYRKPDGTIVTKIYGTDAEVVKTSVGNYYVDIDANAAGRWFYRWFSNGTGQAAAEHVFIVNVSHFV
jgi:hypothetical protein